MSQQAPQTLDQQRKQKIDSMLTQLQNMVDAAYAKSIR